MNSSNTGTGPREETSPPPAPSTPSASQQEALQAEAIANTRRRVHEQQQRSADEALLDSTRRPRRSPWDFAPDTMGGLWFELFGARMMMGLGFGLLWVVVSSAIWLVANLRMPIYVTLRALDVMTGAHALPDAPWLMWALWGAIFGGSLGYWLVAPLYGNRENRSLLLLIPLLTMVLLGGLLWALVP